MKRPILDEQEFPRQALALEEFDSLCEPYGGLCVTGESAGRSQRRSVRGFKVEHHLVDIIVAEGP